MTPLFKSTYDALRFAYNFNGTNFSSPKIGIQPSGNGNGLGGLDGAAEAGNIKRIVNSHSQWIRALIECRFLPSRLPCSCRRPCCCGWAINSEWKQAVLTLSKDDGIVSNAFSFSGDALYRMDLIGRYFSRIQEKEPIADIAARARVNERTARRHYSLLIKLLRGTSTAAGMEDIAIKAVDATMRIDCVVGDF